MDTAKIQDDEWRFKNDDLEAEHKTPGARESLRDVLQAWPASDLYGQRRGECDVLPKSKKTIALANDD